MSRKCAARDLGDWQTVTDSREPNDAVAITVPTHEEWRSFPRFSPANPVRISMFDGNAVASDGIITDLSETGARVFTRQGLTEDDTITIDLRSGGIWLFKARGHVVWRRDDVLEPADATIGSAQGICFADLSVFARKLVRRLSSGSVIEAAALDEATQPGSAQAPLTMDSDPDLKFILSQRRDKWEGKRRRRYGCRGRSRAHPPPTPRRTGQRGATRAAAPSRKI